MRLACGERCFERYSAELREAEELAA